MGAGIKKIIFKKRPGVRVRICNIVDSGPKVIDSDLNGRVGVLTKKFPDIPCGQIGIYIEKDKKRKLAACKANIMYNECEVLD